MWGLKFRRDYRTTLGFLTGLNNLYNLTLQPNKEKFKFGPKQLEGWLDQGGSNGFNH